MYLTNTGYRNYTHFITKSNTTINSTKAGYWSTSEERGGFSFLGDFKVTGSISEASSSVAVFDLAVSKSADSRWVDPVVTVAAVWVDSLTSPSTADFPNIIFPCSADPMIPEKESTILGSPP